MKAQRIVLIAATAGYLATVTPGAAFGCGYDVGIDGGISTAHEASVPVALAVYAAVGAGRLAPLAEAPAPLALMRANSAMGALAGKLNPAPSGMPAVAVLFVEAHLWGRVISGPAGTRLEAHVEGPAAGDVVLVTAEPVLNALLERRITWDAAVSAGLIVVEGPSEGREHLSRWLAQRLS